MVLSFGKMKFTRKESRAPLIHDNLVIALIGSLKAFDSKTGKLVWENMDVRGKSGSPIS